jgi:hypothetical protein
MTELYNHPDARQITDVVKAQELIAGNKKPEKEKQPKETRRAKNSPQGLKIVKMPNRKSA